MAELDAIRELARACKREALADASAGGGALVSDVDPTYYARLEALLGRPYSEQEAYAFRVAFESAVADEQNSDATASEESA
jgi:hypothetical protein